MRADHPLDATAVAQAAARGEAAAQTRLGLMYLAGHDHAAAVEWFRQAAAQGHALAQYSHVPS